MVAKKTKKAAKRARREYTKADVKELRAHSKAKTPVDKDSEVDQAVCWFAAAEGAHARYRAWPSALGGEGS